MKCNINGFGSPRLCAKASITMPIMFFNLLLLFNACGPGYEEKNYSKADGLQKSKTKNLTDSLSLLVNTATTDTINGIEYNFIKKTTLKCKVNNLLKTTEKIEDIIGINGGYITYNDYNSENSYTTEVIHQKDSLLKITHYTPQCSITAKVPTKLLDSVMRKIVALAEYVDTKKLSADNVRLKLMANKLFIERKSNTISQTQLAEKSSANKYAEKHHAIETVSENQSMADERLLKNLELVEQVNYSEINLMLYQDLAFTTKTMAKPDFIKPYERPFINRLGDGLIFGLKMLGEIVIVIVNCWGIIAICIALYLGIKFIYQRPSKKLMH